MYGKQKKKIEKKNEAIKNKEICPGYRSILATRCPQGISTLKKGNASDSIKLR